MILLQTVLQGAHADAELFGSTRAVAVVNSQSFFDGLALDGMPRQGAPLVRGEHREIRGPHGAIAENRYPAHNVLEFADVARPAMGQQDFHGRARQGRRRFAQFGRGSLKEMARQRFDIRSALPQISTGNWLRR